MKYTVIHLNNERQYEDTKGSGRIRLKKKILNFFDRIIYIENKNDNKIHSKMLPNKRVKNDLMYHYRIADSTSERVQMQQRTITYKSTPGAW